MSDSVQLVGGSSMQSAASGGVKQSRFRRFSGLLNFAVKSVAKGLGLSSADSAITESVEAVEAADTPRMLEMAMAEKYKEEAFAYRVVLLYYGLWEPPPNAKDAAMFYERVLVPKISMDTVKDSLIVRGKDITDLNKLEMIKLLAEDLALEAEIIGKDRQQEIRRTEVIIKEHEKQRQWQQARLVCHND